MAAAVQQAKAAITELVRAKKNLEDCTFRPEVTGRINQPASWAPSYAPSTA